jgi:tellurite resistance protein TerC
MGENENNSEPDPRLAWLQKWLPNLKVVKRAIVAVVGFSVLLVGIAMIVLPGPAFIVIPLGLAILATEFVWAARLLQKAKDFFKKKGACVECGKKIDKKRLAADPPATLCAACCRKGAEGGANVPSLPQISE